MKNRIVVCVLSFLMLLAIPAFSQVAAEGYSTLSPTKNQSSIALRTNLLYDVILVPNISVEGRVFNNYTVYADLMYAGWNKPKKNLYWDLYGVQCGARMYFGEKALERSFTGHHAGIYAQALAYDLQAGNLGQQTITINMGFGLEYGYAIPIARYLNLDFEIGIGYLGGKYDEYDVNDTHYTWRATINRNWIGPTKASVTLMWLIKPSLKSGKR